MSGWLIPLLVGAATGVLSGFGGIVENLFNVTL